MKPRVFKLLALSAILSCSSVITTAAQQNAAQAVSTETVSNLFVKKRYSIKGEWSISQVDGETQIRFSDDFNTKGGPDLKVFLSKIPIEELDNVTAGQDTISIGVLKSKSGGQSYTLPNDINLTNYKSVIIHCSAFSVLWGGFDLPEEMTAVNSAPKP